MMMVMVTVMVMLIVRVLVTMMVKLAVIVMVAMRMSTTVVVSTKNTNCWSMPLRASLTFALTPTDRRGLAKRYTCMHMKRHIASDVPRF